MHVPVLLKEVIEYLDPKPNENFIDATIGGGGHADEILKRIAPHGQLLGVEWNPMAANKLQRKYQELIRQGRMHIENDNFKNLGGIVKRVEFFNISGVLFDLGLSSEILEGSGLGFSFKRDEPLTMRYDGSSEKGLTAEKIINTFPEKELANILYTLGGERWSRRIARAIVEHRQKRQIETAKELAEIVTASVPKRKVKGRHPATKTFQALRVFANQELENLSGALPGALEILNAGGRLAVISYHSLEDRIVKNFFREMHAQKQLAILTSKPIQPKHQEILKNPRARSAKLRAAKKL